jgi:hypothetical protein
VTRLGALDGRPRQLAVAAVLVALASLTRYLGVALVPVGALAALRGPGTIGVRVTRATGFVLIATAPLALWLTRNVMVTGTVTGERAAAGEDAGRHVWLVLDHVTRWWLPTRVPAAWRVALVAAVVVAAAAALPGAERRRLARTLAGPAPLFVACYVAALVLSVSVTAVDAIGPRLLAPAFVFLVPGSFVLVDAVLRAFPRRRLLRLLVVVWLLYPAARVAVDVGDRHALGAGGYARDAWHRADVVQWLRGRAPDPPVVSNAPEALYLLTGIAARGEATAAAGTAVIFSGAPAPPAGWPGAPMRPIFAGRDGAVLTRANR